MTAARPAAKIQGDPEDNERKQYERKVREFHDEVLTSMAYYIRSRNPKFQPKSNYINVPSSIESIPSGRRGMLLLTERLRM